MDGGGRLLTRLSSLISLFCCISDPQSSQSPEEVLALNAAAIIANIKLQRQLSKKTSSNVHSETNSSASPQANSGVTTTFFHLCLILKHWSFLRWAEILAGAEWTSRASAHWACLIQSRTWCMLAASERCQITCTCVWSRARCEENSLIASALLLWQLMGNVWGHIQIRPNRSSRTSLTLPLFLWLLNPRAYLRPAPYRWVQLKQNRKFSKHEVKTVVHLFHEMY